MKKYIYKFSNTIRNLEGVVLEVETMSEYGEVYVRYVVKYVEYENGASFDGNEFDKALAWFYKLVEKQQKRKQVPD